MDDRLEAAILRLLERRADDATICPSAAGEVEVTQGGRVVDVSAVRGPIRIPRVRG